MEIKKQFVIIQIFDTECTANISFVLQIFSMWNQFTAKLQEWIIRLGFTCKKLRLTTDMSKVEACLVTWQLS